MANEPCAKLNIAVVLYNKAFSDIASLDVFRSLCRSGAAKLFVFDNSTDEQIKAHNKASAALDLAAYTDNGGNIGLSKSYNKMLSMAEDRDSWIMLSDDDTLFSEEYMENVLAAINSGDGSEVLTGIVKAGSEPFSPKRSLGLLSRTQEFIEEPGRYKNIYAINSGLVVKRSVFDKTGKYDESLFLDMVDHYFMHRLMECGICDITVLGGDISQSFSGNSTSYSASMKRFKIFRRDYAAYCRLCGLNIIYRWLVPAKRYAGIVLRAAKHK